MSLEQGLQYPFKELDSAWVESGMASWEMYELSSKVQISPSEAPNYFKAEQPLEEGEHSYLLTLLHDEDNKPFVLLSLEAFRTQDVGEQAYTLLNRGWERVEKRWGKNAALLRVGQLRIKPDSVHERGVGNYRDTDLAITDAIATNLPQMLRGAIYVQED